jgi:hypothetical protein
MSGHTPAIYALPSGVHQQSGVRLRASLLLPSFGVVVFAVSLVQVLFLSSGTQGLFRDSDTGWHVRNGEIILQTFELPRTDRFSYTGEGRPWFAWEWLSDAVFAAAYRISGLAGVAFTAAVVISIVAWGAACLSLALGADLFFTSGAVVVLLGTTSIHWLARPHVFSWVFALAFLAVAEQERRSRGRWLYVLPALACLWANMHGSFLLGPVMLFIYAAAGARFVTAGVFSLLATLINPYGWRLHRHVLTYLQDSYLMDHISEFRSFSFHSPGARYVELFLLIAAVGILTLLRRRAYAPAVLGLAMLHIALYSARHMATAAVLVMPVAAAALSREARKLRALRPLMDYADRIRAIDRRITGAVPLALVLIATAAGVRALERSGGVEFNPKLFPVQAADFLERNDVSGRLFSKDQWGGYLIFRFQGRRKVFIDGRSDFYGREMLETYATVADVKPGWDVVLRQYDVRLVLIPPDHALASVLELSPDWKRIYSDTVAAVFERTV